MSGVSKDRVKLLVEALRDPAAKQTRRRLGDHHGYCCLGIACEVAIANGLDVSREVCPTVHEDGFRILFDGSEMTLPESVRAWYGFRDADPVVAKGNGRVGDSATSLNDDDKLTFPQIADRFAAAFLDEESAA